MDTNQTWLIGRLVRNAELKYTASGTAITKFSLAVNEGRKVDGEWKNDAHFFDIVVFGKLGESLSQYLLKGKRIALTGKLSQERWDQDGQTRSKVVVKAFNIQLLSQSNEESPTLPQAESNQPDDNYDCPF